ncbi:Xenotropic and polytropic retrovirus receptor 1 [Hamiltosporidium tvaerminnensis]|nr:Xenotropic and polytropic retrovirus receptor 1 [Hamiltosporidium tvaerminnensis]
MKFTQTLLKCQANEWKEWYIAYQKLKEIIKKEPEIFKQSLLNELNRINEFYIFIEKRALEEKEIVFSSVLGDAHSDILEVQPFRNEESSCDKCNDSKDKSNVKGSVEGKENNINEVFNSNITDINDSNINNSNITDINDSNINNHYTDTDINNNINECNIVSNPNLTLESCINNSPNPSLTLNPCINNNNNTNDSPVTFLKINSFFKKHSLHRKREKLLIDFISTLSTIKKYKDLNFTGFQKILKKFDKKMGVNLKDILLPVIKGSYFNTSKHIEKALEQSKNVYRSYFAKSNSKAKSVFRRIIQEKQPSQIIPFMSGMSLTLGVTLFFLSCKSLPLLIPLNILILASLLFGLNMVIFDLKFINYKLIFQHDISSSINTGEYLLLIRYFMSSK